MRRDHDAQLAVIVGVGVTMTASEAGMRRRDVLCMASDHAEAAFGSGAPTPGAVLRADGLRVAAPPYDDEGGDAVGAARAAAAGMRWTR